MSALSPEDQRWLESAVRLARARLGTTGSFPAAAVLIVDAGGQVLAGRGITGTMGHPAALVAALADARGRTDGGTAYLTIEPDGTDGPYESEAEKLANAGIERAVIGLLEPDPQRRGRGVALLRARGLDVVAADHPPAQRLAEGYASRLLRRRPFVTAVLATSTDGMIGTRDADPVELLTPDALRWLATQRSACDAVLTTARALAHQGHGLVGDADAGLAGPLTIIVAGRTSPADWLAPARSLMVIAAEEGAASSANDAIMRVPARNGRLDMTAMMRGIAERDINNVQVRAGARVTEGLLAAELVDRFHLFESTYQIGRGGIPATPLGALDARLRATGFEQQDERLLGDNRLRTFERVL